MNFFPIAAAAGETEQAENVILDVFTGMFQQIPLWILGIIVIIVSVMIAKIISNAVVENMHKRIEYSQNHDEMIQLVHRISMIVVISFGTFIAMKIIGLVDSISWMMTAMVAGLGFSLQGVLGNFLAGVAIILQDKIHVGDIIQVGGDLNAPKNIGVGKVVNIGSRATTIESFDGYDVMIPNLDVITQNVIIYTSHETRRIMINVGVDYKSDMNQVKQIIKNAILQMDAVLKDKPIDVFVMSMDDNAISMSTKFWVNQKHCSYFDVFSDANQIITEALIKNNIEIPFPQRVVHMESEQKKTISKPVYHEDRPVNISQESLKDPLQS
jgi:small-conductance mechanosensitive channel